MKQYPYSKPMRNILNTFLIPYKKQWASAGMALILGGGCIAVSFLYQPPIPEIEERAESIPEETRTAVVTTQAPTESETQEQVWLASLTELNLAHYFPEGEEQTDITKSLAGTVFHELMTQDANWSSAIYSYSDVTPAEMVAKLGLPRSKILGSYNPEDSRHQKDNPSTWEVGSFRNVRIQAVDGDGNLITPYSNVSQIMSLANVYTYYHDPKDKDAFLAYARALWNASHSYTMSVSDLYYCSGCIGQSAEEEELKALEAEAEAEKQDQNRELPYEELLLSSANEENESAVQSSTSVITAGLTAEEKKAKEESRAESMAAEKAAREAAKAQPESTSGVITAQANQNVASASNAEAVVQSIEQTESSVAETVEESVQENLATEAAAGAASKQNETRTPFPTSAKTSCPGHVDLTITMKIGGLKEAAGLFALDAAGNDTTKFAEGGWQGWTPENRQAAIQLASEDWYQKYGLSVSSISTGTPLTASEIETYLSNLPADTSETRKKLLRFALNSVGKVPYYWGGKPAAKNYEGNRFGTLVSPDVDGRTLKGLDCSGWISWVYWSVTGTHLPYESTSGLAVLGKKVSREELKPGDILIRTGADAHVVMFLGWTADGKVRCIHETSGSVNNVTVGERNAGWPYYRRLVD